MLSDARDRSGRLHGIDVLRGLVMVLMVLDHSRDYFGDLRLRPENLANSTPQLFATRWITHFCAPVFVFLAGVSAFLGGRKRDSRSAVARHLFTRGLWLILLEVTVISVAWQMSLSFDRIFLQVIWAIGIAMVTLSFLVFLPARIVGCVGLAIVLAHNLLDDASVDGGVLATLYHFAYEQGPFFVGDTMLLVLYPFLPWIGVMALGYGMGPLFASSSDERRGVVLVAGLGGIVIFVLLRWFGMYGEPVPWESRDTVLMTIASFLNCTKYPPSLQFLAMTLGPALVFLCAVDQAPGRVARRLGTFGRVPLFFYVAHLALLSASSAIYHRVAHGEWFRATYDWDGYPPGYGNGLWTVYLVWIAAVVVLYPACAWYEGVKRRSDSALLRYL